jgi:hypothetical protein
MTTAPTVLTAQYLRMSTDEQKLSLPYQAAAIRRYAQRHGFIVEKTYEDSGRSGLTLKRRKGLMQLLEDAVSRRNTFKAALVYDVSRWGRFQDTDESGILRISLQERRSSRSLLRGAFQEQHFEPSRCDEDLEARYGRGIKPGTFGAADPHEDNANGKRISRRRCCWLRIAQDVALSRGVTAAIAGSGRD